MNTRSKLMVLGIDLLILVELTFTMYFGHTKGEDLPTYFLMTFLPMAALTLVFGRWIVKRWGG